MAEWYDWTGEPGPWQTNEAPDLWAGGSPQFNEGGRDTLSLEDQVRRAVANRPDLYAPNARGGGGGTNWLSTIAGLIGPAASAVSSIAGGARGASASREASRLQSDALTRGIDLQTAQWLQQQANQAPWLQAGREALPALMRLAGQGAPESFRGRPGINPRDERYNLPGTQPGWSPQQFQGPQAPNAEAYRWTPGQGPRAADYRYTPGQTPDAAAYTYTPGAVPTLSGAELLANDPGVQFRMDEARKGLEASALARGSGMSGAALSALQRQSQDQASQEYGAAYGRASEQAQLREQWAQRATSQNFGQAMSAAELRERVNQVATQQGWSQAQAEAAFREQMAQQSSQQGWNQALQGQQNEFGQDLQAQQWNQAQAQQHDQEWYNRIFQRANTEYGRDTAANEQAYGRELTDYNSWLQSQNTLWNRLGSLANIGQTATNQVGNQGQAAQNTLAELLARLGQAQGTGAAGEGLAWTRALGGVTNNVTSTLAGLNR